MDPKLRNTSEAYISIQFCVDIDILYFYGELTVYLSCYLQNKCLFFPRFILFILLHTNRKYQIESTLSFKSRDIYHQLKIN